MSWIKKHRWDLFKVFTILEVLVLAAIPVLCWWALAYAETGSLTWKDNSNNEDGFRIERQLNGSPFSLLTTTGPNVQSFVDNSLVQTTVDNVYCYRVQAFNKGGSSAFSNVACKTIDKIIPIPAAPSDAAVM